VVEVEAGGGLLDEPARRVLAHRHHACLVLGEQHGQAVGGRDDVVVHQPDPVEAVEVRLPQAEVEAAGAAEVVRAVGDPQRQVAAVPAVQHRAGVVAAGVVDDVDRVGTAGLGREAVEHPRQQVGAVERHHDDRHLLGAHRRNLW
jgi:hypothetical protein